MVAPSPFRTPDPECTHSDPSSGTSRDGARPPGALVTPDRGPAPWHRDHWPTTPQAHSHPPPLVGRPRSRNSAAPVAGQQRLPPTKSGSTPPDPEVCCPATHIAFHAGIATFPSNGAPSPRARSIAARIERCAPAARAVPTHRIVVPRRDRSPGADPGGRPDPDEVQQMALMRRVAALGAAVAAARQYARQNPDKVNRYADQAASFIDQRTHGRFRRQLDTALRQVRKETSVPGRAGSARARPASTGRGSTAPAASTAPTPVSGPGATPASAPTASSSRGAARSAHHLLEEAADAVLTVHEVHLEDPVAPASRRRRRPGAWGCRCPS